MSVAAGSQSLERGRQHFAQRAWQDAYEALSQAARESAPDVADVERLAVAAGLTGRDEEFLSGLERAYELHLAAGNEERAAYHAFWLGFRLLHLRVAGRAGGWLARARAIAERPERPSVVVGYLRLPQAYRHLELGELDAAAQAATEAGAVALEFRDRDLEALAQSMLGRVLLRQGHVERGLSLLDLSILTVSTDPISPNVAGVVYCAAIANASRVFALDRAREWTDLLTRFCEAQPQLITFSGTCFVHCSEIHQTAGAWPEALRTAERARERTPMPAGAAGHALYQCAEIKRVTGDFVAAEELYVAASEHGYEPQPGLSLLRLAQGRVDAAAIAMRRVLCATVDAQERLALLPAGVTVLLASGALDEARTLVVELEAAARHYGMDVLRALAAQARGSLHLAAGEAEAALAPLGMAFEILQRLGAPYLGARVRVELGAACGALGDLDGKNLHLAAARAVFEKLGARHDLLLLGGTRAGQAGLSARELEVLRLVACGKTNKAIARELCLSEKTVDRHVSNIFTKLDVNTRAAATAYAYQHRLA